MSFFEPWPEVSYNSEDHVLAQGLRVWSQGALRFEMTIFS